MNINAHLRSLSSEIDALKNRVRDLIDDEHWLTDGEWKESVLRIILRRYLPANIGVGRGFVIRPDSCSRQIDILLFDSSKPTIYRDGDLVMVTPDAVVGIIEVKTTLTDIGETLDRVAGNAEFIQRDRTSANPLETPPEMFVGLFSYEWPYSEQRTRSILRALQRSANQHGNRIINHLSLGNQLFIHYWRFRPEFSPFSDAHQRWHAYKIPELARGYFIHNVISSVARSSVSANESVWFPPEGKEFRRVSDIGLIPNGVRNLA